MAVFLCVNLGKSTPYFFECRVFKCLLDVCLSNLNEEMNICKVARTFRSYSCIIEMFRPLLQSRLFDQSHQKTCQ